MAVITISRELGSNGDWIAREVARALAYHFVDKDFIANLLRQYGLVEFDMEYDTMPTFWEKFDSQKGKRREIMVDMLNRVIRALASQGEVVILGRSGFAILSGFAEVLNIRIQAPYSARIKQVMEKKNITAFQAEDLVQQADHVRANFVKSFYGVPWDRARAFDLIIDTGKIPPQLAQEWIVAAVKELPIRDAGDLSDLSAIAVDPILTTAITRELARL